MRDQPDGGLRRSDPQPRIGQIDSPCYLRRMISNSNRELIRALAGLQDLYLKAPPSRRPALEWCMDQLTLQMMATGPSNTANYRSPAISDATL